MDSNAQYMAYGDLGGWNILKQVKEWCCNAPLKAQPPAVQAVTGLNGVRTSIRTYPLCGYQQAKTIVYQRFQVFRTGEIIRNGGKSMPQEKKERAYFWLQQSLLNLIDSQLEITNSRNRSEYVCQAVEFYSGFTASENAEKYLSETLLSEMDKRFKKNEKHISTTIFKLAVELGMVLHVIANQSDIDGDTMERLHKKCIKEVKSSVGNIRFDKAYEFQHSEEDEDE